MTAGEGAAGIPPALRRMLERTWYAFLGRFPHPTAIQERGIPAILAGESVLLAAATATGKTEAYAAPLVERMLREKWAAPGLLVVSPTRALTNDLFRRLEAPLAALRVPLARRTGDHSEWDDTNPGAVVVTTPESLDSLLARRPDALKTVRAIVLDELHVLDGTARGDQLAILVTRLERLVLAAVAGDATRGRGVPLPLQRVAATATAVASTDVARRYLGPGALVVQTDERREIQADLVEAREPSDVSQHLVRLARESGGVLRKVLVFTNSRADAENLASACRNRPPYGADVFVHHASLARPERERVEKRFLAASTALCFATMTLELGIDIGDIDCVGLIGPPPNVASLLQRMGRGNRRTWDTTRVTCFYRDEGQRARFEHLLEKARCGDLGRSSFGRNEHGLFRPSVLVQQAFSLVFQSRGRFIDAVSMVGRLPAWVREEYPVDRIEEILSHLASTGWLKIIAGGRYGADDRLESIFRRGTMHSNIAPEAPGLEVVDEATERVVGTMPDPTEPGARRGAAGMRRGATSAGMPDEIVLGGQRRAVRRVGGRQVRVTSTGEGATAEFRSKGSPAIPLVLARSLAAHLGLGERTLKVVRLDLADLGGATRSRILLAHFLGSAYGRLFTACLEKVVPEASAAGNAFVTVLSTDLVDELHFSESMVLAEISKHRRALSAALQDGPHSCHLPPGWWVAWLQESLDVPRFLSLVDTFVQDHECGPDLRALLISLAPRGTP